MKKKLAPKKSNATCLLFTGFFAYQLSVHGAVDVDQDRATISRFSFDFNSLNAFSAQRSLLLLKLISSHANRK